MKKVADSLGITFFLIGASARDFILRHQYGIELRRKTGDIDLGVEVANWNQFKTLFDSLISTGEFSRTSERQRLRCGIVLIDILPFGLIKASANLQELRRKIYSKAKTEKGWKFWGLYCHICV